MDAKQMKDGDFVENTLGLFKMYKQSWEAFKLNWAVFLTAYLSIFVAAILGSILVSVLFVSGSVVSSNGGVNSFVPALLAGLFVFLLVAILVIFIAPLVINAQLASARGKTHTFGEFYETSKSKILGFLGLAILMGIVVTIGFVLLILPGLIAIFFLSFAPFIYMDRKIGIVDAMKASYELVKVYWKITLGLFIVNAAVSILGSITFIGQIAAAVLSVMYFCLTALVYVKIVGKSATVIEAEVVTATKKVSSPKAKK